MYRHSLRSFLVTLFLCFSVAIYAQGIQPVWLQAENRGEERVRVALWSVDEAYFSPMEVAWKNRKGFSKEGRAAM